MTGSIRYSRQLSLPHWGKQGQRQLSEASIAIVGLGGLGLPAASYLAAAGLGRLVLNDFDTVDESNLARQPVYTVADLTRAKVGVAAARLNQQNPDCDIQTINHRLDNEGLGALARENDVLLDCSDNFTTRFAVNSACVRHSRALVSGAAIRYEAQLAVFRPDLGVGPCYRCLYDESSETLEDCQGQGVLAPMVGLIGCAMALEALRVVIGFGDPVQSRLQIYDALTGQWRDVGLPRDPACPVCAGR